MNSQGEELLLLVPHRITFKYTHKGMNSQGEELLLLVPRRIAQKLSDKKGL